MTLLTQRKQLGLEVEAVEGTPEAITASEIVTVLEPKATINLNNVRPPVQRGSFSKVLSGTGIQDATVTYKQQFAGPADGLVTSVSPLGKSLRSSGFRQFDLYAVRIDTAGFAGTGIVVGDLLVSNTTASTIRVVALNTKANFDHGEAGGANNTHYDILFFEQVSGGGINATDTSLVAANSTLPVATVSHGGGTPVLTLSSQVATRVGTGWLPTSQQTKSITISSTVGGPFTVGETIYQTLDTASPATALRIAYGRVVDATATSIEFVPFNGNGNDFENAGSGDVTGVSSGATATVDSDAISLQTPTLTTKLFEDGIIKTFAGGRSSSTMTLPVGDFPVLDMSVQSAYISGLDGANIDAGGAAQGLAPTFLGAEFRVGRVWIPCVSQIAVDFGQNLVRRTCQTPSSGLEGFAITDRTPTLTMDPETVQEAIFAAYGKAKAATAFSMQLRWGAFAAGTGVDAWLFSADQCQYEALNDGERDNLSTHESTIQINSFSTVNESEMALCNYNRTTVDAL